MLGFENTSGREMENVERPVTASERVQVRQTLGLADDGGEIARHHLENALF
jgi:hypothetical protein